jgi:hypothetical protein
VNLSFDNDVDPGDMRGGDEKIDSVVDALGSDLVKRGSRPLQ